MNDMYHSLSVVAEVLRTRAEEYERGSSSISSTPVPNKRKFSSRNRCIMCEKHEMMGKNWGEENNTCGLCVRIEKLTDFKPGLLPQGRDVLSVLLTLKEDFDISPELTCASKLALQWIYCNVYPQSLSAIKRKVDAVYATYRKIGKFTLRNRPLIGIKQMNF